MKRVSVSRAWEDTRAIFARDGRLLVAVALAMVVLPLTIAGVIVPADGARDASHGLIQVATALIGMIGQLALIRLAIGPTTTVGAAIGHGARRFPSLFGAMILLLLLFALLAIPLLFILALAGTIDVSDPANPPTGATLLVISLLVIAAIAVSAKFMMTSPVASAEAVGPVGILKRSWRLTNGYYWKLLAVVLLLLVTAIVLMAAAGALGGILGRIISPDLEPFALGTLVLALIGALAQGAFTILSSLMVARLYVQLAGAEEPEVSVPSSGT